MYAFSHFFVTAVVVAAALLAGAGFLHQLPRLGDPGRRFSAWFCRAPGLDWAITYFTAAPLIFAPMKYGWAGLIGAIAGQVGGVVFWIVLHEQAHKDAVQGPRIVKVLNQLVGRWQNHAALWLTAVVTPMFWIVRMAEVFAYPPLTWLVGFPRYKSGEWVNVSRQKFSNLVGHDLIWCLYCDWMTGVWSLGTEMLRNVESFWCPIRFGDAAKCDNCKQDFPDLELGWVDSNGDMKQVTEVVEKMHGGEHHAWFGHRVRLTVKGKVI